MHVHGWCVHACPNGFLAQTLDCGSFMKLCFPARALFTPLKMQMLVINPAFAHLFGGTAPCFIKPIYHSRLPNQWDAVESSVSTEARGENTSSLRESGGETSTEAGIDQSICHTL